MIRIAASVGKSRGFHTRPGSRAAVLDERTSRHVLRLRVSEEGSGSKARSSRAKRAIKHCASSSSQMGGDRMISVPLFVNGGGMRGGEVHYSIEGLPFLGEARTAPRYRFFSVRDEFPGLWPVDEGGVSIPGELYDVPLDVIRDRFIPAEPPELELSVVELDDGSSALVVLVRANFYESGEGLKDISEYGGWRAYRASMSS
jgi:hypothetical protein